MNDLMRELAEARESYRVDLAQLREERQRIHRDREETRKMQADAESLRERARLSYRRFMKQLKRKWSRERQAVELGQRELQARAEKIQRQHEDTLAREAQIRAMWEQIQAARQQVLQERAGLEQQYHEQNLMLERRTATVLQQEKHFVATEAELTARIQVLQNELAGLDERAANARAHLEQLESRIQAQTKLDPFGDSLAVPIPRYQTVQPYVGGDTETLLQDLHTRQQELDRARRKLMAARNEVEQQATTLEDQRAVLVDQVAALVTARELWSSTELATVAELESIALALWEREQRVAERETEQVETRKQLVEHEAALNRLREDLAAWRALLHAEAETTGSVREAMRAQMEAFRRNLAARESELDGVVRTWAEIRERERGQYESVLEHYRRLAEVLAAAAPRCEEVRLRYLQDARNLAAIQLAVEQTIHDQSLAGKRRLRVLQRRWERHFHRWQTEIENQLTRLKAEQSRAEELNSTLAATMERWLTERNRALDDQILRDGRTLEQLAAPIDDSVLNVQPVETALRHLREQIDSYAHRHSLMSSQPGV